MKNFCFILVLCCLFHASLAQSFEGRITYANTYKSKMDGIPDAQFTAMMGSTITYYLKEGNYKTVSNGSFLQWQIYRRADNRLYSKLSSFTALLYHEGSENNDEVLKSEINKNAMTILGHPCDELVLTCKSGVQRYYFASEVKADPAHFANHKFGNWSEVISQTHAVPLKMVIENVQFTVEILAREIISERINDTLFTLPPDVKIEKSPF